MKKEYNNLRTVALRILPALVLVIAITVSLAAPAQAVGFDYSDYIFSEVDGVDAYTTTSRMPVTQATWSLLGFPSEDLLSEGVNGDFFTVDHSQLFLDNGYIIVCEPFGTNGIDVTNIRTGSTMDFSFTINTSVTDDAYEFMKFTLELSYWTADNQYISSEIYQYDDHSHFGIFDIYDLPIYQPAGADHMRIALVFYNFDLYSYQSGDKVGFFIDDFKLHIIQPKNLSSVTLYDYSGQTLIDAFRDIEFPCTIIVGNDGFTIENYSSTSADYVYTYSGDSKFLGISEHAYNNNKFWAPGSVFNLSQSTKFYLMLDSNVPGCIEIFNYTGSYPLNTILDVKFPCTVRVATDGLYFTYAGSVDVDYFFPYGSIPDVAGVSLIACDKEVQYPIGSVFTLSWDSYIYLIREKDLPKLDPGDSDSGIDDYLDIDGNEANNFFVDLMLKLDIPYANTLALFWESTMLHDILLMAALFALFSFVLFGKKG